LTRSASVTGLLGHAASRLISLSAICAEEGGCDQEGIAAGKLTAELDHRILYGRSSDRALQGLSKTSAIATFGPW
jgi:hypothetical protein